MKKTLKKLAVLICTIVLAVMPVSSAFASTQVPIVSINVPGVVKVFSYQPSYLEITDGIPTELRDITTSTGEWDIPAGKGFRLQVTCDYPDVSMLVKIQSKTTGALKYYSIYTSSNYGIIIDIPAQAYNDNYVVTVDSSGISHYINSYAGIYLDY
ncbi:MAG TPA: hypothetical protein GXX75_13135 [Clostridiales bacterium]|nr:hypothetical protein [Clostridiales bacterium]